MTHEMSGRLSLMIMPYPRGPEDVAFFPGNFEIVGEAEDGREAIDRIVRLKPDLVITDLSMPKMDGMDMIGIIKKKSPQTRIIALTVHRGEQFAWQP